MTPDPRLPHHPGMDRRHFLLTSLAGVLAAPLAVDAQQPGRGYRIGYIAISAPDASPSFAAFQQGLRELGWLEGRNVVIEYRYSAGRSERLPPLAAELVRLVDVIVANAALATLAAKQATATIPIVGVALSDPVGQGLATSLVRPGGNVTGLASLFPRTGRKTARTPQRDAAQGLAGGRLVERGQSRQRPPN